MFQKLHGLLCCTCLLAVKLIVHPKTSVLDPAVRLAGSAVHCCFDCCMLWTLANKHFLLRSRSHLLLLLLPFHVLAGERGESPFSRPPIVQQQSRFQSFSRWESFVVMQRKNPLQKWRKKHFALAAVMVAAAPCQAVRPWHTAAQGCGFSRFCQDCRCCCWL
jgi:hypothetical protein